MAVIQKNQLVILPAGARFMLAGTAPEMPPRWASNFLGRMRQTQGVLQVEPGGTLVSSPLGLYVVLAERAFDEAGVAYESGTTVFIPPDSFVSCAAKVGGDRTGEPLRVIQVQPRPYPRSAKAMAAGMAMAVAAIILGSAAAG